MLEEYGEQNGVVVSRCRIFRRRCRGLSARAGAKRQSASQRYHANFATIPRLIAASLFAAPYYRCLRMTIIRRHPPPAPLPVAIPRARRSTNPWIGTPTLRIKAHRAAAELGPTSGLGPNPDFLLGGPTSASAECRHWSGRAVRWSCCAILLSGSAPSRPMRALRVSGGWVRLKSTLAPP